MMKEEELSIPINEDRGNKKSQQSDAFEDAKAKGFVDPISQSFIMKDPVQAADEKIYERESIEYWFFSGKKTSPLTNTILETTQILPAQLLRKRIGEFLNKNKHLIIENQVYLPRKYLEDFAEAIKDKNIEKITKLVEADIRLIYMSAQQAIQKCGTKYRDETEASDRSGFHLACEVADIRIIMQMLEMLTANSVSLDFITAQKPSQWNPLVLNQGLAVAIENGNEDTCREFLSIGADANFTGQRGNCLHRAVKNQKKKIVELLLASGANINAQSDKFYQQTSLHVAVESGNLEIAKILLEAGAKTEIQAEKKLGHDFIGDRTLPLHEACRKGNESMVKLLVQHGADIEGKENREDRKGNAPLMWASSRGDVAIVEFLLKSKANTETKDNLGWTALHWAAREGQKEVIKLLMKHEADHKVKDRDDFTPIEVAQRRKDGGKEIVNLISELHRGRKLNAIERTKKLENLVEEQKSYIQKLEARLSQLENDFKKLNSETQSLTSSTTDAKQTSSSPNISRSTTMFFETSKSSENNTVPQHGDNQENLQKAIQESLKQAETDEAKQPTNQH